MPTEHLYRAWLTAATTSGIIVTVGALLITLLVQTVQKPERRKVWPRLKNVQMTLSGFVLILTILHCVLLAQHVSKSSRSDPVLVSALFEVLCWLVLGIFLFEGERDAELPHFSAWASASLFQALQVAFLILGRPPRGTVVSAVDLGVLVIRFIFTAALLGSSLALLHNKQNAPATEDETRPLLGSEINVPKATDTTAQDSEDSDSESDKDEGEDEDEDEEDKEARKELKKRSFAKYLASFRIFLPHLIPSTVQQWGYITVIFICIFIDRAINVVVPLSIGALINSLPGAIEQQQIPWKYLILYLSLHFVNSAGIVSTTKQLASVRFDGQVRRSLSMFCYSHLMSLSCDYHDGKNSQRANRIMERGTSIAHLFDDVFFDLFPRFSDLFIALGVVTWLFGGYLCFVVATTIILFSYANMKFIRQKTKIRRKWMKALIAQWDQLWESLFSWTTVTHFSRAEYEKSQARERRDAMYTQEIRVNDYDALASFVRQVILCTGYVVATYMAIQQIVYQGRGIGDFVMLQTYWSQIMSPVASLTRMINSVAGELVDAERVMLLLEKQPTIRDKPDAKTLDFQGGAVEFENVSFSYDGERIVSDDISFRVEAGQTVAIVGETGGGKSTLLKLLFRFYDPTKGRILVDGQDLKDFKIDSFRELVGFVPQDPAMFQKSVADNIRYADLTATDEEVEAACKGAVLHDKIMSFTKGYKQKVGERGTRLSGGEAQRLAVARVVLKKPKMLLLDEATSSVDSVTESKIHEGLKELCKGRTTFIIAHRLSTILHADLILVVKNGKLVEQGPHRKLIKKNGAYRELWTAQLKLQSSNPDGTEVKTPVEGSPVLTKSGMNLLDAQHILVPLSATPSGASTPRTGVLNEQKDDSTSTPQSPGKTQEELLIDVTDENDAKSTDKK